MPALTIKNIPEDLYEKLKISSKANRRSLNSEFIYSLEKLFNPKKIEYNERIRRAREIRPHIKKDLITPEHIIETIRKGRP